MGRHARIRYRIELTLAAISAALFALTVASPEWIEAVFGVEPDGGSGALEWAITIGFLIAAATLVALGWRDRRRLLVTET